MMTGTLFSPKLPVNLPAVVADVPPGLQRPLKPQKNPPDGSENMPRLIDVCRQMESLFIYHLFKEMRAGVQRADLISGGRAEEIYTSMMDAEIAANLSKRGGIGLARMLQHQLSNPPPGRKQAADWP